MTDRPILLDVPEELTGPRIVVRPFRDLDAEPMFAAIQDSRAHIRRFLPWPDLHRDVSDTLAFIRGQRSAWVARTNFGMGVFLRSSGEFVGGTGLHPREWRVPSFEIGYWIRKSAEGNGYVTEAAALASRLAFDRLGAQRVIIRCDTRNSRSCAIPRRLGYTLEGTLRNETFDADGNIWDALLFSLIPQEYHAVSPAWPT
jgi:RimJ/RimL family protein N-acetyltransferase